MLEEIKPEDVHYSKPPFQPETWTTLLLNRDDKIRMIEFHRAVNFIGFNYGTYFINGFQFILMPPLIGTALDSWFEIYGYADMDIEHFLNQLFPEILSNEELGYLQNEA